MTHMRTQDARAVAFRTLCLGALLKRGEYEIILQNSHDDDLTPAMRQRLHATCNRDVMRLQTWLRDEKLLPHLTETERILLEKPLGTWSDRLIITASWRVESLGVMLWALHALDYIPAYDTQFDPATVLAPLEVLTPTIDFIWCARLRSPDELAAERDAAEMWNWRSRALELQRMGVKPPAGVTFREIVRLTALKAYRQGNLNRVADGDFAVFGKPYYLINEDEFALASAIAYERYFALNWLCELSHEWENIPVDI